MVLRFLDDFLVLRSKSQTTALNLRVKPEGVVWMYSKMELSCDTSPMESSLDESQNSIGKMVKELTYVFPSDVISGHLGGGAILFQTEVNSSHNFINQTSSN